MRRSISRVRRTSVLFLVAALIFSGMMFQKAVPVMAANSHSLDLESDSSQYAFISSPTGLSITGAMTLEAWVKPESQPSTIVKVILNKMQLNSDYGYELIYGYSGGSYGLSLVLSNGSQSVISYSSSEPLLPSATWTHVAVTYTPSTKVEFFINGVSASSVTSSIPSSIGTDSSPFVIGHRYSNPNNHYWDGLVDDARVWNVVRSSTEINNNYKKELIGNESNLQGYWKLNNDYQDATANNNDLTASGSPSFLTDVPSFAVAASLAVAKTSDESVTSSTTLHDDSQLALSLNPANTTHVIEGLILASSASDTPDLKIAFVIPSGATMHLAYIASRGTTFNNGELLETSGGASINIPIDNSLVTVIFVKGTVQLGSTTGSAKLQWAQSTSSASATTVRAGSFLTGHQF